uniref:Carbohydrate sulfotransferase n=1 Tax=Neogobius melanostomus TaxID=47308 RepID=A0A8C6WIC8_9GOBI
TATKCYIYSYSKHPSIFFHLSVARSWGQLSLGSMSGHFSGCLLLHLRLQSIQEQRKAHLQEACHNTTMRGFEELTDPELKHLIVDDKHGIIYCYVPKVECTNWKRVLFVLNQSEPYPDIRTIHRDVLTEYSLRLMCPLQARLKHYTKFLFVRDPFVRLISAYRNKFVGYDDYFYKLYGRDILRQYGHMPHLPDTGREAFGFGIRPSFQHFVKYLIDPRTEKTVPFEPHWRQIHRLCHPCSIQYDFIGHLETLQEDANLLLKILKLDRDISFPPSPQIPVSANQLWDWFKVVPLEDRRRLYRIYELDFQLFGYAKPYALLD